MSATVEQKALAVQQHIPVSAATGLTIDGVQSVGRILATSGYFNDAREMAQAAVKVMAGQELGIPPVASMMGINIIKGKVALGGNLIATQVRKHGYDYRFLKFDKTGCEIQFLGKKGEPDVGHGMVADRPILGTSSFDDADAKTAGISSEMYKKYPRNMFFNRAMSNGAKWFCPEATNGIPTYTPEELGAHVDADGNYLGDGTGSHAPQPAAQQQQRAESKSETAKAAAGPAPVTKESLIARMGALAAKFDLALKPFVANCVNPFFCGFFGVEDGGLPKDPAMYDAPLKALESLESEEQKQHFMSAPREFGRTLVTNAAAAIIETSAEPVAATEGSKTETEGAMTGKDGWTPWDADAKTLGGKLANARGWAGGMSEVAEHVAKVGLKSAPIADIKAYLELSLYTKAARLAIQIAAKRSVPVAGVVGVLRDKIGGDFTKVESHALDVALAEMTGEEK